jgi:PAS domain S-box-containing protein
MWETEGLAIRKNGEVFPLWISVSCLRDEAGNIRGSVGISRDISLLRQYKEMTGYMAELVEKASLGIISTDPQNRIVSINKAAEAMYGYRADEIIGRPIDIVYSDRNPDDLLRKIKEKADKLQPWSAELYRRRKDGREFISWLSTAYIYGPMGNLKAKVCIERDVTEQREMEKRLSEARNLASMGELAAGVAHEIRNPLGGILASAKMLLDQKGQVIGEEEISLMGIVEKEAKRLENIATDFLRFGRPQEPIFSVVDINRAVGDMIDSLKREKVIGDDVDVEMDLLPRPTSVCLDENQMKQVFLNLAINAEQAMGGKGKLTVRISLKDDMVDISLEDTGGGISSEDLKNVFRPFFSRKKGGTGLGLAIVSRIIAAHHGTVHCQSELGKGTKFTISLPVVK